MQEAEPKPAGPSLIPEERPAEAPLEPEKEPSTVIQEPLEALAPLLNQPTGDVQIPERIGPYQIVEVVGEGAMAVVYKAFQPSLDRLVAIKSLRARYVYDAQISQRFAREAESLATLQHGSIVHVYDYFQAPERAYIVMEYVDGVDLFNVIQETGAMPVEVAIPIALAVAEGLEHAHFLGIVHRDIKPSNILISYKGEIKLMDFGIALDKAQSSLTQVGLAVGTPSYMAPEQIRGDVIDFRVDHFALGVVLYELLSGHKPWVEEEDRSITAKVLDEPFVPLQTVAPHLPHGLVAVVHRCLNKQPKYRFQSTRRLCQELRPYLSPTQDPRARVALFLLNRKLTGNRLPSANIVPEAMLKDFSLREADLGHTPPSPQWLEKRLLQTHAIGLGLILVLTLIGVFTNAAPPRPELALKAPKDAATAAKTAALPKTPAITPPAVKTTAVKAPAVKTPAAKAIAAKPPAAASSAASTPPSPKPPGEIRLLVRPWARVYVDGRFFDTTPFDRPIRLSPGAHEIQLRNPYYHTEVVQLELAPHEQKRLSFTLKPK